MWLLQHSKFRNSVLIHRHHISDCAHVVEGKVAFGVRGGMLFARQYANDDALDYHVLRIYHAPLNSDQPDHVEIGPR